MKQWSSVSNREYCQKNSFSDRKVLLFWRQIGVCLPFENGSVIEKRIEVRYSKRELEYNFRRWWRALFGFLLTVLSFWDNDMKIILVFKVLFEYLKVI